MGNDSSKTSPPCTRPSMADRKISKGEKPRRKAHSIGHSPPSHKISTVSSQRDSSLSPRSSIGDRQTTPDEGELSENSAGQRSEFKAEVDFDRHFMPRRDRLLVVKSWRKTQKTGPEHVGSKIFLRVLIAQPDIKAIFGLEKIPQGRLKYDPRFRQHAIVYTKTLDYVVKNLEWADKLEHHFDDLGKKHVAMQGRGFDPVYWDTFAECMTQAAAEWDQHRHRPTTTAWRLLITSIITFMRRGYDEEQARRRAMFPRTVAQGGPTRKISGYAVIQNSNGASSCPFANAAPTFTASQAQEIYQAYTNGDNHLMCPAR